MWACIEKKLEGEGKRKKKKKRSKRKGGKRTGVTGEVRTKAPSFVKAALFMIRSEALCDGFTWFCDGSTWFCAGEQLELCMVPFTRPYSMYAAGLTTLWHCMYFILCTGLSIMVLFQFLAVWSLCMTGEGLLEVE